jgi:hypothetical protein
MNPKMRWGCLGMRKCFNLDSHRPLCSNRFTTFVNLAATYENLFYGRKITVYISLLIICQSFKGCLKSSLPLSLGLVVNGFINVVITTIERRFGLQSRKTGFIASGEKYFVVFFASQFLYLIDSLMTCDFASYFS